MPLALARHQARAHLPLRQNRLLSTRTAQPRKHVGKRLQAGRPGRKFRRLRGLRQKAVVRQEESVDSAVKDDDFDLLIGLQGRDDFTEPWNNLWPKDIQRWVIERSSPVRG